MKMKNICYVSKIQQSIIARFSLFFCRCRLFLFSFSLLMVVDRLSSANATNFFNQLPAAINNWITTTFAFLSISCWFYVVHVCDIRIKMHCNLNFLRIYWLWIVKNGSILLRWQLLLEFWSYLFFARLFMDQFWSFVINKQN